LKNGIIIDSKIINFELSQIICDAPAKSFLLRVKNHNGYFGCNSCEVKGEFFDKVCFIKTNSPLRTNVSFRNKTNIEHHKEGDSPIIELPIDIPKVVVVDYMHCVCLGVMKRLLEFWTRGKKSIRISEANKTIINNKLLYLRTSVTSEFARLPRTLNDLEYWKATEYREFLLYTGIIVLKGTIRKDFYNHFLLLFISIRILSSEICFSHNIIANELILKFVDKFALLYGREYVNYNVHSLIHLPFYVISQNLPLHLFSAFKYENYLQQIKKFMKCGRYPLSEVYHNRLSESEELSLREIDSSSNNIILKCFTIDEYHSTLTIVYYTHITLKNSNYILSSTSTKDQYLVLENGDIVAIQSIYKNFNDDIIKLTVLKVLDVQNLFINPLSSKVVGVFLINNNLKNEPYNVLLNNVKYKCFYCQLPLNQSIVIQLCHGI